MMRPKPTLDVAGKQIHHSQKLRYAHYKLVGFLKMLQDAGTC